jgi:hypothetical protein
LFEKGKKPIAQLLSRAPLSAEMASGRRLALINPHFYPQRVMSFSKNRPKSAALKRNSTERLNTPRYVRISRSGCEYDISRWDHGMQ